MEKIMNLIIKKKKNLGLNLNQILIVNLMMNLVYVYFEINII